MDVTVSKSKTSEVAGCELDDNSIDPFTLRGDLTSSEVETSFFASELIPKTEFSEVLAYSNGKLAHSGHARDMTESDSTSSETDPGSSNDALLVDLSTNESSERLSLNNSCASYSDQDSALEDLEEPLDVHLPPPTEFSDNPSKSDVSLHGKECCILGTNTNDILDEELSSPAHFQADIGMGMGRILDFENNLSQQERESVMSPGNTLTQIEESPWEKEAAESNMEDKRENGNYSVTMKTQPDMLNNSIDSENELIEIDNKNTVDGNQFRYGEFVESSEMDIDVNQFNENQNADLDDNGSNLSDYVDTDQLPENDELEFVQSVIIQETALDEHAKENNTTLSENKAKQDQQHYFAETQNGLQKNIKDECLNDTDHVTSCVTDQDVEHSFITEGHPLSDSDMEHRIQHGEKEEKFSKKTLRNSEHHCDKDVACLTLKEKLKFFEASANANNSEKVKPFIISHSRNLHTSENTNSSENVEPLRVSHSKHVHGRQEEHINPVSVKKSECSATANPQSSLRCLRETKIAGHTKVIKEQLVVPENVRRKEWEINGHDKFTDGFEEKIIPKAIHQNHVAMIASSSDKERSDACTLLKELSDELVLTGKNQTYGENAEKKTEGLEVKESLIMAMTIESHESEPRTHTRDLAKMVNTDVIVQTNHKNIEAEKKIQKKSPPPVFSKPSKESRQRSPQLTNHTGYNYTNVTIQNSEEESFKQPSHEYEANSDSMRKFAGQNNKASSSIIQEDVTVSEKIKKLNESSLQTTNAKQLVKSKAEDNRELVKECVLTPVKIPRDTSDVASSQHVSVTMPYKETSDQGEIIIPHIVKRHIFDDSQKMHHDVSESPSKNTSIKQMENANEKSAIESCIVVTDQKKKANQYPIPTSLPMKNYHSVNNDSKHITTTNVTDGDMSQNSGYHGKQISATNFSQEQEINEPQTFTAKPVMLHPSDQTNANVEAEIDTYEVVYRASPKVNKSHRKSFPMSLSQSTTFLPKIKSLAINPHTLAAAPIPFKTTSSTDGKLSAGKAGLAPFKLSTQRMSNSKRTLGSKRSEVSPFQIRVLRGILGLGIEVKTTDDGHVKVTEVKPNGPVAKDGNIRSGDYLVSVNETDLSGLPEKRIHQILLLLPRGLITIIASTKPPPVQPEVRACSALDATGNITALKKRSTSLKPQNTSLSLHSSGTSVPSRRHSGFISPSSSISGSYSFSKMIVTPNSTLSGHTDVVDTAVPVVSNASPVSPRHTDKVPSKPTAMCPPTAAPRTTRQTKKIAPPEPRLHREPSSHNNDTIIPAKSDSTNSCSSNGKNTATLEEFHTSKQSHKNKDNELLIDFSLVPSNGETKENTNQKDFTADLLNKKSSNLDDLITLTPDIVSSQTLHGHNSVSLHSEKPGAIDSMPHQELHAGKSDLTQLDFAFQHDDVMFLPQADVIKKASSHTNDDTTANIIATCDTSENLSQYSAQNVQENSVQYDLNSELYSETPVDNTREITVSNLNADSSREFDVNLSLGFPKTNENLNQPDYVQNDIHQTSTGMSRNSAKNSVSMITSRRKWSVITNIAEDIISGSNNSPLYVDSINRSLVNVINPTRIISLLTQANEILETANSSVDDEILVFVLHGADNVDTGIKLTEDSDGKIMISQINGTSPIFKKGHLQPADHLLSLDGVQLFPWELKKAQRTLESSKSEIVLVFAKHLMERHTSCKDLADEARNKQDARNLALTSKYDSTRSSSVHGNSTSVDIIAKDSHGRPKSNLIDDSSTHKSPRSSHNSPRRSDTQKSPTAKDDSEVFDDERTGVFEVIMLKGVTGVGFCIEGGIASPKGNVPIKIKRIYKGGPAEKCGQLKVKDEILKVNDIDFTQMRHSDAWHTLRFMADGPVNLLICRH